MSGSEQYEVLGMPHSDEDIVLCVDMDSPVNSDLKASAAKGQSITRLVAIKQALLLFVHSKLVMSRQHRFAIATIGHSASWHQPQFYNDFDKINSSVRTLAPQGSCSSCDLSSLFQLVQPYARASKQRGRAFRVIFIYCRSDVVPTLTSHPPDNQSFVFDVLYLHDKPTSVNCPQEVYDFLVEILERVNPRGFIYESGSGLSRVLFRHTCQLLAHPEQRSQQDD